MLRVYLVALLNNAGSSLYQIALQEIPFLVSGTSFELAFVPNAICDTTERT